MDASVSEDKLTPEIYQCQVCWGNMLDRKPRSLTCGHSFCQRCLEKLDKEGRIDCPTCRCQTLTPEGVDKLPLAFTKVLYDKTPKNAVIDELSLHDILNKKPKEVLRLIISDSRDSDADDDDDDYDDYAEDDSETSGNSGIQKLNIHVHGEVFVIPLNSTSLMVVFLGDDKVVRVDNKGHILSTHTVFGGSRVTGACIHNQYLYTATAGAESSKITCIPFDFVTEIPDNPVIYSCDDDSKNIFSPVFMHNDDDNVYFLETDDDDQQAIIRHNIKTGSTVTIIDSLHVCDTYINGIVEYDKPALVIKSENCLKMFGVDGKEIRTVGDTDAGLGKLENPVGVIGTKSGHLLVVDSRQNRVCLFDKSGTFLKDILTEKEIKNPLFLALQGRRLWVTLNGDPYDSDENSIVKCFLYE